MYLQRILCKHLPCVCLTHHPGKHNTATFSSFNLSKTMHIDTVQFTHITFYIHTHTYTQSIQLSGVEIK